MPKNPIKADNPEYQKSTSRRKRADEASVASRAETLNKLERANSDTGAVGQYLTSGYADNERKRLGRSLNKKYQPAGGVLNRDYHKSEK